MSIILFTIYGARHFQQLLFGDAVSLEITVNLAVLNRLLIDSKKTLLSFDRTLSP
jgi:hypothetical protein